MKMVQILKIGFGVLILAIIIYSNGSSNKDFDIFYDRFYTDLHFQLKSVKFPLKSINIDKKVVYQTEESWVELGDYNLIANSKGLFKQNVKIEYLTKDTVNVIFKLDVEDVHAKVIHKFIKINGQWFLTEVEDQSSGLKK